MEQLKAGVIGCGSHAQRHFAMIAAEPRLRLAAIAEIDPARLKANTAEHRPDRSFADYRQMLAKTDLNVVYVVTMPGQLTPIVLDCLERDLHVSVEKPPGMSSADTERMADAAQRSKGKAMVSFNRRYIPEVLAVRRLARERGGVIHCAATYNQALTTLGTPAMSGIAPDPVICDAIHHVDLLRWLAGSSEGTAARPVEIHATAQDGDRAGAQRQSAVIGFDNGAVGVLMSNYGVGYRIQRAEVHAEDLSVYLDLTRKPRYEVYEAIPQTDGTTEGRAIQEQLDLGPTGGAGHDETGHFVDCILNDRTPWSTLDDAVYTMRLCEAIRRGHKGSLWAGNAPATTRVQRR